jgi:hypothetical protein
MSTSYLVNVDKSVVVGKFPTIADAEAYAESVSFDFYVGTAEQVATAFKGKALVSIYNSIPGTADIKKFATAADAATRTAAALDGAEWPEVDAPKGSKPKGKTPPEKGDVKKSRGRTRNAVVGVVRVNPEPLMKMREGSLRWSAVELLKQQRGNKMPVEDFIAELQTLEGISSRGSAMGVLQKLIDPKAAYLVIES